MFKYVKHTNYPINISKKDLRMAKYLITQFGGAKCKSDVFFILCNKFR